MTLERLAPVSHEPDRLMEVLSSRPILVYLITASKTNPAQESFHRNELALHLPTALTVDEVSFLGSEVDTLTREVMPHVAPNSDKANRQGHEVTSRTILWLGKMSCNLHDLTTAESAAQTLKKIGGLSNRRAARKLQKEVRMTRKYPHNFQVYSSP